MCVASHIDGRLLAYCKEHEIDLTDKPIVEMIAREAQ
jgi:hypothetical protein